MDAACDEAGDVGGVEEEERSDLVGDLAERDRIDDAGIRGRAGHDQLGALGTGEITDLVEVDPFVRRREAVRDEAKEAAARRSPVSRG